MLLLTVAVLLAAASLLPSSSKVMLVVRAEDQLSVSDIWYFDVPDMTNPKLSADGLSLNMIYPVSDFIKSNMVSWTVWDRDCTDGTQVTQWFDTSLVSPTPATPQGTGSGTQILNISIAVDPASFDGAPASIADQFDLFDSEGAASGSAGRVQFCLEAAVHTEGDVTSIVDRSETMITVDYDLTSGFEVQFNVAPVQNEENARDSYGPEGYWCDDDGNELGPTELATMGYPGSLLKVCVVPNEKTRLAGFGLDRIDSFGWVRTDEAGGRITQTVIADGQLVDELSELYCSGVGAQSRCQTVTLLKANFFVNNALTVPTEMPSSSPTETPSAAPTTFPYANGPNNGEYNQYPGRLDRMDYGECTSSRSGSAPSYSYFQFNGYPYYDGGDTTRCNYGCTKTAETYGFIDIYVGFELDSQSETCKCLLSAENPTMMPDQTSCSTLVYGDWGAPDVCDFSQLGSGIVIGTKVMTRGLTYKTCHAWVQIPTYELGARLDSHGQGPCVGEELSPLNYITYGVYSSGDTVSGGYCEDRCLNQMRWYEISQFYLGYTVDLQNNKCICHLSDDDGVPSFSNCGTYGSTDCTSTNTYSGRIGGADNTNLAPGQLECYGFHVTPPYRVDGGSIDLVGNGECRSAGTYAPNSQSYKSIVYNSDNAVNGPFTYPSTCESTCIRYTRLYGLQDFFVGFQMDDTAGTGQRNCICNLSVEEGTPNTATGPTTTCSSYDADSCSFTSTTLISAGHIAGVDVYADNAMGEPGKKCYGYLPTPYHMSIYGNVLDFVGSADCQGASGVTPNYLRYDEPDGNPWTVNSCRDYCVRQTRRYGYEDDLVGLQMDKDPLSTDEYQCSCLLEGGTYTPSDCASYGAVDCNMSGPASGAITQVGGSYGAQPGDKTCYGWAFRSYADRNNYSYLRYKTLQKVEDSICADASSRQYKYLQYSKTSGDWTVEGCRQECEDRFNEFSFRDSLVGFYVHNPSDSTTNLCTCYAKEQFNVGPTIDGPGLCSAYPPASACDAGTGGSGFVAGTVAGLETVVDSSGNKLYNCWTWMDLGPVPGDAGGVSRRRSLEEVEEDSIAATHEHEDLLLAAPTCAPPSSYYVGGGDADHGHGRHEDGYHLNVVPDQQHLHNQIELHQKQEEVIEQTYSLLRKRYDSSSSTATATSQEEEEGRKGRSLQTLIPTSKVSGEGIATVKFGQRYRRNLKTGEEHWEDLSYKQTFKVRDLQQQDDNGNNEPVVLDAPLNTRFNMELTVQTGGFLLDDLSGAATTSWSVFVATAATAVAVTLLTLV